MKNMRVIWLRRIMSVSNNMLSKKKERRKRGKFQTKLWSKKMKKM